MAVVEKWLTQRIVAPSFARSNRVSRPIFDLSPNFLVVLSGSVFLLFIQIV